MSGLSMSDFLKVHPHNFLSPGHFQCICPLPCNHLVLVPVLWFGH